MKLKSTFITHVTGGEQIMVDAGGSNFSGLVKSNETAACIVDCLKQDTSLDAIVDKMCEEYDAPREVIARDVSQVLDKLRSIGAIDE